ncbi:helix-hairpin-helix domain-containing protein [Weissella diestrammenae]|nr:helix-hairpin-helix domain-containing protein [Weissella diestrammenae]MCM0583496.1 helix-hairpin-helix domain-containing protein [Weissella diestrammenae]
MKPGVYQLIEPVIVNDVIKAAGGLQSTSATHRVNFAARMTDGQVLYIPNGEEVVPEIFPLPGISNERENGGEKQQSLINLNQATLAELQNLPGIGAKRAADIIATREAKGAFKRIEDLRTVSGIGDKTLAKISELIDVP